MSGDDVHNPAGPAELNQPDPAFSADAAGAPVPPAGGEPVESVTPAPHGAGGDAPTPETDARAPAEPIEPSADPVEEQVRRGAAGDAEGAAGADAAPTAGAEAPAPVETPVPTVADAPVPVETAVPTPSEDAAPTAAGASDDLLAPDALGDALAQGAVDGEVLDDALGHVEEAAIPERLLAPPEIPEMPESLLGALDGEVEAPFPTRRRRRDEALAAASDATSAEAGEPASSPAPQSAPDVVPPPASGSGYGGLAALIFGGLLVLLVAAVILIFVLANGASTVLGWGPAADAAMRIVLDASTPVL